MVSSKNIHCYSMILLGYFLLEFITPARGINCYQCSSTNNVHPFQCNEYMSEDIDISPTDCSDVWGAKYCVKHVGRFEGGVGTKRFCSSANLGNDCHYTNTAGDDQNIKYRTCIYTCDSDGCNSATKKSTNIIVFISLLIAPIVYLFQR
ncbi:U-scoloptoxin(05)-Sm1a isoform X1 [Aphidius gifuensis]|uniref:U-scoloptoxin(05)-Sm1a isoform X1 n=1 Tax=Aphidius gifuensis TaxID=684658 RepID=UPI001CDCDE13|nr:U-scoloptoxin(05)-Sm1a isoform X1 [Aphidius gifuensis]